MHPPSNSRLAPGCPSGEPTASDDAPRSRGRRMPARQCPVAPVPEPQWQTAPQPGTCRFWSCSGYSATCPFAPCPGAPGCAATGMTVYPPPRCACPGGCANTRPCRAWPLPTRDSVATTAACPFFRPQEVRLCPRSCTCISSSHLPVRKAAGCRSQPPASRRPAAAAGIAALRPEPAFHRGQPADTDSPAP